MGGHKQSHLPKESHSKEAEKRAEFFFCLFVPGVFKKKNQSYETMIFLLTDGPVQLHRAFNQHFTFQDEGKEDE